MKRILILLMALCLVFSFAACGSKPSGNTPSGNDKPAFDENASLDGVINGDAYENEYLNLRIALPGGWFFYSDAQMAAVNNMTAEVFSNTSAKDAVKTASQYMDMMMSDGYRSSVNFIVQPNDKSVSSYTDKQIFTLIESTFKKQMSDAGMPIDKYEVKDMKVGGEDRTVLYVVLSAGGASLDEYQIWYRVGGEYMGILTLTLPADVDPQPYFDGFTALK